MSESNDTDARKSETTVQRRDNWNDGEIRMLLDMWADDTIQESLESSGRNIVVYRRIADRFNRALRYGKPGTDGLPDSAHAHLSVSCLKRLSLEAVWTYAAIELSQIN